MSRWTPKDAGTRFHLQRDPEAAGAVPFAHQRGLQPRRIRSPMARVAPRATTTARRATFLSGAKAASGAQPQLGITVDQVAVKHLGQDTPLPSLELMIEEASHQLRRRASAAPTATRSRGRATSRRCPCRTTRRCCSSSSSATAPTMRSARAAHAGAEPARFGHRPDQGPRPHAARVRPRAARPLRHRRARDRASHQRSPPSASTATSRCRASPAAFRRTWRSTSS